MSEDVLFGHFSRTLDSCDELMPMLLPVQQNGAKVTLLPDVDLSISTVVSAALRGNGIQRTS